jgi:UDP-galactopyranose mutase
MINIVGAGLTGLVLASQIKDCVLYERDKIGGMCIENKHYQKFPHIFHTNNEKVVEFLQKYTTIRPYIHFVSSYSQGNYTLFPPKEITQEVFDTKIANYTFKMWQTPPREGLISRLKPSNGKYFIDKYQGLLDMNTLFDKLIKGIKIVGKDVRDGDLKGKVILTGAIDEYFNYCYGHLPYRGMKVKHIKSERGLPTAVVNYPDLDMPFIRITDYKKLGFKGQWLGIETPSNDKIYPVDNKYSQGMYKKYKELADKKGIILCGRLANYKYIDIDKCVEQALELLNKL